MINCGNCNNCECKIIESDEKLEATLFCQIFNKQVGYMLLEDDECEHYEEEIMCSSCEIETPTHEYEGKLYCLECLLEKLEDENKIETWSVKHFMVNGEYIGNDDDNDFDDLVEDISKYFDIKKLEE